MVSPVPRMLDTCDSSHFPKKLFLLAAPNHSSYLGVDALLNDTQDLEEAKKGERLKDSLDLT